MTDMSIDPDVASTYAEMLEARQLLADIEFPTIQTALLASTIGLTIQALLTGKCLYMLKQYLSTSDVVPIARLGMAWIVIVLIACVATANLQQSMVIKYAERFTAWQYQDFFIIEIQLILNATLHAPILLFFVRRAYHIWDKSRLVVIGGNVLVGVSLLMSILAAAVSLRTPYGGFKPLSNQEYADGIPYFIYIAGIFTPFQIANDVLQLLAVACLCFLICYGIYRHRNGYKSFDTAVSKIAFINGESLFPLLFISTAFLALDISTESWSALLLRPLTSLSPAVYAHALLTALTSKNRIREALQAEPVRQLATFATSVPALPSGPDPDPDLKGDVLGVFDKSAGTSSGVSGGAVSPPTPP